MTSSSGSHSSSARAPDVPSIALRARGIDGIEKVRVAYIESDGDISALTYRESGRHQAAAAAEEEKKTE